LHIYDYCNIDIIELEIGTRGVLHGVHETTRTRGGVAGNDEDEILAIWATSGDHRTTDWNSLSVWTAVFNRL